MREIGVIGYSVAAIGFLLLTILLITSWRGRTQGALLVLAALVSTCWAIFAAYNSTQIVIVSVPLVIVELLHNITWLAFIVFVLNQRGIDKRLRQNVIVAISIFVSLVVANVVIALFSESATRFLYFKTGFELTVLSQLLVAIFGLILVEQLFRNATSSERWSLKYMCFGLGGYFGYDVYLYSDALFYKQLDDTIWVTRGYISAIIVPLIAVSAARNPQWSLDVFVSRKVVFHTATITIVGVYLFISALGSYYIGKLGGTWSGVVQLLFLFVALLILATLIFSGEIRGKLRISVNKHFFNYRYDYRDEWLKFIATLSNENLVPQLRMRVISAIAAVVDSPGGMLWLKNEDGYSLSAVWNVNLDKDQSIYDQDIASLVEYMSIEKQVVDVDEGFISKQSKIFHFPDWNKRLSESWLFVPLLRQDELYGFILLMRARAELEINWENLDLLITTGRQATNDLALFEANEKLLDAHQFDAFNRLSAYLVHDLKNISAQLNLVVKNSERHKQNPEFFEDVILTVENSVGKMNKMLSQLRSKKQSSGVLQKIDLLVVTKKALANRQGVNPRPQFVCHEVTMPIIADAEQLTSVLEHLVQNAQDASQDTDEIIVSVASENQTAIVTITDNGCGMDADFIRSRLFRPFDTTKGNAGMGIGLYESREIIRSFGGTIRVNSEINKGTVLILSLKLSATESTF